jgi:uncharacterized protein YkwD
MQFLSGRCLRCASTITALLCAIVLAACGGSDSNPARSSAGLTQNLNTATGQQSGDTASDGFSWFNQRRLQVGLAAVSRNGLLDTAAQGHSSYQQINNVISHGQVAGAPGFTGQRLQDRLAAAGYRFSQNNFAYGEVISATSGSSGAEAAEDLIGAIYHRFVIFEPMFTEAGAGAASASNGLTYFTVDFTANGLSGGLGRGNLATYPAAGQQGVETAVLSDQETPDPVPDQNQVGYPISVHADIISDVVVRSFTVSPRGGSALPVRLHTHEADPETPTSAAAIIPLAALAPATTYDVQFSGTVDGIPANRSWSFTTR